MGYVDEDLYLFIPPTVFAAFCRDLDPGGGF